MTNRRRWLMGAAAVVLLAASAAGVVTVRAQAPAAQTASQAERTVWYFYRVKWGFQDEFVSLFAHTKIAAATDPG